MEYILDDNEVQDILNNEYNRQKYGIELMDLISNIETNKKVDNINKVDILKGLSNPQNLVIQEKVYITPECKGLMNPRKYINDNKDKK
tara:strand:+ start:2979 stop:3242 length:264 start_codon:yes stop_codon:yes gene_type:complete